MSSNNTITILKDHNQDFEHYPTTNEIIKVLEEDIKKEIKIFEDENRYKRDLGLYVHTDYKTNKTRYNIKKFLDIGAGSGKVSKQLNININDNYAIEKSDLLADSLVQNGFHLIGRDYYETHLMDRNFDIVFTNPPYSDFKIWIEKVLQEVNAIYLYILVPKRWANDTGLKKQMKEKGEINIIKSFDFLDSEDRKARAKVDLIKIKIDQKNNTFDNWISQNMGEFKKNDEEIQEEKEKEEELKNQLEQRDTDKIKILWENYSRDLKKLIDHYKSIGELDFSILEQLGLNKSGILKNIKSDVKNLKTKYWKITFNLLEEVTNKLTYRSRNKILNEITIFQNLDYNKNNVRTVIIWTIENYNNYVKEQLIKSYDDITESDYLQAYKSNTKFLSDTWRYINKPEKYTLDYRIVSRFTMSKYGWQKFEDNIIKDLIVTANNLGFKTTKTLNEADIITGTKHYIKQDNGRILFEYKTFQNGNIHFKFDIEFMKVFNIEAGKEKGWIKAPQDVMNEFDLDLEESVNFFTKPYLQLLDQNGLKLLA